MTSITTCLDCGKAGWVTFAGPTPTVTHIQRTDHPFRGVPASRSGLDNAVAPIAAVPSSRPDHGVGTNRAPGAGQTT